MLKYLLLFLLIFSIEANAIELSMSLSHEYTRGKVFIKGATNLPTGTKVGVTMYSSTGKNSGQSFGLLVKHDGTFISEGFTNKGKPLAGSYSAEVFTYLNNIWQSKSILSKLQNYSGKEIDKNKISVVYTFSIDSSRDMQRQETELNTTPEYEKLVKSFCFALEATTICKNLDIRADTERKIEKKVGDEIRGSNSPYNQACFKGLRQAFNNRNTDICLKTWNKYGCYGTEIPRLLQENPFRKKNGIFCEY